MLPSPPDVMPGDLACERTDSEHGHERNQFQRGAHDLAKVTVRPGKCTPCYSKGVVLAHWGVPFGPSPSSPVPSLGRLRRLELALGFPYARWSISSPTHPDPDLGHDHNAHGGDR